MDIEIKWKIAQSSIRSLSLAKESISYHNGFISIHWDQCFIVCIYKRLFVLFCFVSPRQERLILFSIIAWTEFQGEDYAVERLPVEWKKL